MSRHARSIVASAAAALALGAYAQQPPSLADKAGADFEKFRAVLEEDNPAELFEAKGEELWKAKRGPRKVSLAETCDLGLGVGVVKGAYVQTPRYYADVDRVMDIERRIVHCMVTYQGFSEKELAKKPFSSLDRTPDPVSLVTYVAGASRGMKIAVPQKHPKEREAFAIGSEIFRVRAGPWDFSCATCHGEDGKRIRTQNLPNLATRDGSLRAYQGWPGYRMTGGVMHTLQWRMNDCFRQQRFPEPAYVSDSITALLTYLGATANGHVYKGPGIKR
ncbi:MAG: sulfur oxidation c-type cytochrome SoxA [Rhodocyclaceae bacterium]